MPADLTEFAKENDIQLLTHNDEPSKCFVGHFQSSLCVDILCVNIFLQASVYHNNTYFSVLKKNTICTDSVT